MSGRLRACGPCLPKRNRILPRGYACVGCRRYSADIAKASLQDSHSLCAPENPRSGFASDWSDANGGRPARLKSNLLSLSLKSLVNGDPQTARCFGISGQLIEECCSAIPITACSTLHG